MACNIQQALVIHGGSVPRTPTNKENRFSDQLFSGGPMLCPENMQLPFASRYWAHGTHSQFLSNLQGPLIALVCSLAQSVSLATVKT